jgi:excisionase family DNA binding protein
MKYASFTLQGDVEGDVDSDNGRMSCTEEWRSAMKPGGVGKHRSQDGPARIYRIEADAATTHNGSAAKAVSSIGDSTAESQGDRLVFSVEEAAYLLNISRALAYELVARGEVPSIRLGRRIVIPKRQLEIVLEGPVSSTHRERSRSGDSSGTPRS